MDEGRFVWIGGLLEIIKMRPGGVIWIVRRCNLVCVWHTKADNIYFGGEDIYKPGITRLLVMTDTMHKMQQLHKMVTKI